MSIQFKNKNNSRFFRKIIIPKTKTAFNTCVLTIISWETTIA